MAISFGLGLGGLFGGCGGSVGTAPEDMQALDLPPLDQEAPGSFETASFALG